MLGRAGILVVRQSPPQNARGMATLKAIFNRRKAVMSTQKITQSMKMVSAAKYTKAESDLKNARPYGEGARAFYDRVEASQEGGSPERLIIALSSDRGLCGAIHSSVARNIRNELSEGDSTKTKVVCIGDKSRAILQRTFGKNISLVANEVGRKPPTFLDAAKIAAEASKTQYSNGKIVFNKFRSVVSYRTSEIPLFSKESVMAAPKIPIYDSLDEEVVQSYLEFSLASLIYYGLKEGACSEQSSRMTAMDNATKNASEVIEKLTKIFNRTRQAVITRELIEIISGAAALDK